MYQHCISRLIRALDISTGRTFDGVGNGCGATGDFAGDLQAIDMTAHGAPLLGHFAEHTPEAAAFPFVQLIGRSTIPGPF